ncbi:MAG TPA: ImmA/IrrE family metallo-endopeptidase [Planctomycetaceae bacterium]|nr:ImmA/IrrE family metallo-endopeptidase [Planctomycetaceae bacterium]
MRVAALDQSISSVLDDTAARLLAEAEVDRPPVDALDLAARLGVEVLFDAGQAGRARHKRLAGRSVILLKPGDRPERMQWAAAHELGEVVAHRVFERLDLDEAELRPELREQTASLLAARLLLPLDWFADDARLLDGDVPALKNVYSTASHELVAWRLLDLPQESTVTVFDHGRLTRRRSNGERPPPRLAPEECAVWQETHRTGRPCERWARGLRVRCWAIHEPQWKREILRTSRDES